MSKVSIITPCFNSAKFIQDNVLSVANVICGGEFEVEHVVVDDGSSDGSYEVLEKLKAPNLKIFRFEKNMGQSAARNFLVDKIDSDYVFFLDADDVIFQNSLRTLMSVALGGQDWVYGDYVQSNEEGGYLIGQDYWGRNFVGNKDFLFAILSGGHYMQQSFLIKTALGKTVSWFRNELRRASDFDIAIRLAIGGEVPKYIPGPVFLRRRHDRNLSADNDKGRKEHKRITKELWNVYKNEVGRILSLEQVRQVELALS